MHPNPQPVKAAAYSNKSICGGGVRLFNFSRSAGTAWISATYFLGINRRLVTLETKYGQGYQSGMWRGNRYLYAICTLLVFLFTACTTKTLPTSAKLEGNTYYNQFFRFRLQIPEGWTIINKVDSQPSHRKSKKSVGLTV
jgi:hypothetical protein